MAPVLQEAELQQVIKDISSESRAHGRGEGAGTHGTAWGLPGGSDIYGGDERREGEGAGLPRGLQTNHRRRRLCRRHGSFCLSVCLCNCCRESLHAEHLVFSILDDFVGWRKCWRTASGNQVPVLCADVRLKVFNKNWPAIHTCLRPVGALGRPEVGGLAKDWLGLLKSSVPRTWRGVGPYGGRRIKTGSDDV